MGWDESFFRSSFVFRFCIPQLNLGDKTRKCWVLIISKRSVDFGSKGCFLLGTRMTRIFCRFWFGVEFVGLKSNKKWKKWRETFQPQSLDPQVEDKPQGTAGLRSTYWNGLRCQKRLVNTFKVSYQVHGHGHGVNWVTTLEAVWRNWCWVADSQLRWQRVLIDIACCFKVLEVF